MFCAQNINTSSCFSYALMLLIAQNITEPDEIKNIKNCGTKHVCSTKHQSILPPANAFLLQALYIREK